MADLPLEDAVGVASMLVQMGRAIPADKWIESLVESGEEAEIDALF
jgi:hypothetical protein